MPAVQIILVLFEAEVGGLQVWTRLGSSVTHEVLLNKGADLSLIPQTRIKE